MQSRSATYKLTLNGKDATRDLSPFVQQVTYTDHLSMVADELTVTLDNSDGRFWNDWYMTPGMVVEFWINEMPCGKFTIDNTRQSIAKGAGRIAIVRARYLMCSLDL